MALWVLNRVAKKSAGLVRQTLKGIVTSFFFLARIWIFAVTLSVNLWSVTRSS